MLIVPVYVDSSAIVKLAVRETESAALRRYLRRKHAMVSSALARTEVLRALLPAGEAAVARGKLVLQRFDLIRVSDRILNAAGVLLPEGLRSLDAIHLATALELGSEVHAFVSYDERLTAGATALGCRVARPS